MAATEITIEPGRHDIVITRVFDAPKERVFRAFTDPELFKRWNGPSGYDTVLDRWEAESGGTWRYVSRGEQGEFGFRGVFHDVVPNERIVQTFEFEGMPGHVCLETATFEEVDGRTRYTGVSVFQSVEDRDGMAASGMESGVNDGFDKLDELLREQ
ncbi:SRPBCC family protein [Allonocardiopsis opalescens]|uniref:Uncharacterized protein YndB with AHSA1/START domain n=1 Tax=Allonocardiopsis opalescens TaxID=1144618 RepID=A0A2T0QCH4_9ACTN|nr:SRPBCC family protein [Allonocardiopsis opalescens]PRY01619.1 uncharacterized protein YndB with AHSA1/START domain [Allonocardiopsis opalescens]